MKVIHISRRKLIVSSMILVTIFIFSIVNNTYGMQHYYKLDFVTGIVTASSLNVRSGPNTKYNVVATVKKNEYVRVFAGVGDWYIVQTDKDFVGAVNKQFIKPIYPNSNNNNNNNNNNTPNTSTTLTQDEKEVFNLINQERTKQGLSALKIDNELQKVARIKAQDMVDKNYFDHNSPTYGTPFDMLKSFKISYKAAGENIAGNASNSAAVTAWMNSSGHRANILKSNYNHTGIGVIKSPKYGKIYVQLFIEK